jgi:hypothetical protein
VYQQGTRDGCVAVGDPREASGARDGSTVSRCASSGPPQPLDLASLVGLEILAMHEK